MDFVGATLKDMILPGLKDAGDLCLHALRSVEECSHSIDQIIKLLELLH